MLTQINRNRRIHILLLGASVLLLGSFCKPLFAQELVYTFDPDKTSVEFTLGDIFHRVHGSFQVKSGSIRFDKSTGAAQGLIVVDATSGKSGSDGRDQRMHKEILESQRYPEITFMPSHVTGTITGQQGSQFAIEGVLTLHGTPHPVALIAWVNPAGDHLTATTRFDVPYVKWGLKNPSTFILRVSSTVNIDIRATGRLVEAAEHP